MLIFPDECSGTAPDFQPPCRDNEQCTNTFAGFTCSCRCGYTKTSDDTIDPQCTKASDQVCDPWESLKAWYTFDDTLANQHRTAYLGKAEDSRAMLKRDRAQAKNLPTHIYSVNSAAGKALRLEGARLQLPTITGFDVAKLQKTATTTATDSRSDGDGATVSFHYQQKARPAGKSVILLWLQSSGGSVLTISLADNGELLIELQVQASSSTITKKTFGKSKLVLLGKWYQVVAVFGAKAITVYHDHPTEPLVFNTALVHNAQGSQNMMLAGAETKPNLGNFNGWVDGVKHYQSALGFMSLVQLFQIKAGSACFLRYTCGTCSASPGCGWCASSKLCSRARDDGSSWSCDVGWIAPLKEGATENQCLDVFMRNNVAIQFDKAASARANKKIVYFRTVVGLEFQPIATATGPTGPTSTTSTTKMVNFKFALQDKDTSKHLFPISCTLKPLSGADASDCKSEIDAGSPCVGDFMKKCPARCSTCKFDCESKCESEISTFDNIGECVESCEACAKTKSRLMQFGNGTSDFAASGTATRSIALTAGSIDKNTRVGPARLADSHLWIIEVEYDLGTTSKFDLDMFVDVDAVESSNSNNRASISRGNTYIAFVDEAQYPDQIFMGFDFAGDAKMETSAIEEVIDRLSVDLEYTVAVADFEDDYIASFVWYAEVAFDGAKNTKLCAKDCSGVGGDCEGCCLDDMCRDIVINSMMLMCGSANSVIAQPMTIHGVEIPKSGSSITYRAVCGDSLLLVLGGFKMTAFRRLGASAKVSGNAQERGGIKYYFHGVHFPNNKLAETDDCQTRRRRRDVVAAPKSSKTQVETLQQTYPWVKKNVACDVCCH